MLRHQEHVLGRSQKSKQSDAMIPKMINYIRQKGWQRRTYSESAHVTTKDWARNMLEHTLDISFQKLLQIILGDKKHVQVNCLAVTYTRDRKCSEIGICLVSIFAWSKKNFAVLFFRSYLSDPKHHPEILTNDSMENSALEVQDCQTNCPWLSGENP